MGTTRRVVEGVGWIAAAALLALLVSTNCSTTEQAMLPSPCGPDGTCPAGFFCIPADNLCYVGHATVCAGGNPLTCPIEQTCYPPRGAGEKRAVKLIAFFALWKCRKQFGNSFAKIYRQAQNRAQLNHNRVHLPVAAREIDV